MQNFEEVIRPSHAEGRFCFNGMSEPRKSLFAGFPRFA